MATSFGPKQKPSGRYRRVLIGHIEPEGGDPRIEAAFFANANEDPEKELVVIVSWEQVHYDAHGTLYGTMVYARPSAPQADSFRYLKEISEKVSGSCECEWRDGRKAKSRFKTAAEVKAALRKLGYR